MEKRRRVLRQMDGLEFRCILLSKEKGRGASAEMRFLISVPPVEWSPEGRATKSTLSGVGGITPFLDLEILRISGE